MKWTLSNSDLQGRKYKPRFNMDSKEFVASLFMTVSCDDKLLKYNVGRFQQKAVKKETDFIEIDTSSTAVSMLTKLVDWVAEYEKSNNGKPILKNELENFLLFKEGKKLKHQSKENEFFSTLGALIDRADPAKNQGIPNRILIKGENEYSPGTIKNYRLRLEKLKKFSDEQGIEITFGNITIDTYNKFTVYLQNQVVSIGPNKGKKYTNSYVNNHIKDWTTLLKMAYDEKKHTNIIFKDDKFRQLTLKAGKTNEIFLNDEEIQSIIRLEGLTNRVKNIRDRFVIDLYTGLRISDMKSLTMENFDLTKNIMTHFNKKTKKPVASIIHPEIRRIIHEYGNKLPRQYSDQEVNRELKKICKKAGITETRTIREVRGGKPVEYKMKKYDLITNHTARRSMATNMSLEHVPDAIAQSILGMSPKTHSGYVKSTAEEKALSVVDHPFFKKNQLKAV